MFTIGDFATFTHVSVAEARGADARRIDGAREFITARRASEGID